jgi:hypothetical protein
VELPVRIVRSAPHEPVVLVDGSLPAAQGLQLSHWPGNRTPAALRDDLSTGCALRFARLEPAERERLAAEATAIVNNHYDTDGTCALFAVRHPRAALEREDALLAAARAGDFFAWPDDRSLALDAIVAGLADPSRSPLADELAGRDDQQRHQLATDHLLERLPDLLDGDLAPYRGLWEPILEAARCDRDDLARCTRDDVVHLDWSVWTASAGAASSRPGAAGRFDPGRHALFGASAADRALAVGPGRDGTTYRLVISTLSWFDLPSREPLARPDLAALAGRLNELEGSDAGAALAWRHQGALGPSPELWFGADGLEPFAEHAAALRPSRLEPARVRREIAEALRDALLSGLET